MDELNTIATLLQNGAFPIAMVAVLCVFIKYMMDKFEKVLTDLKESINTLSTRVDTILDIQESKGENK